MGIPNATQFSNTEFRWWLDVGILPLGCTVFCARPVYEFGQHHNSYTEPGMFWPLRHSQCRETCPHLWLAGHCGPCSTPPDNFSDINLLSPTTAKHTCLSPSLQCFGILEYMGTFKRRVAPPQLLYLFTSWLVWSDPAPDLISTVSQLGGLPTTDMQITASLAGRDMCVGCLLQQSVSYMTHTLGTSIPKRDQTVWTR